MQSFTNLEEAFDTALLTVPGMTATGVSIYNENDVSNFAMQPSLVGKIGVRTSLISSKSVSATYGINAYVNIKGFYAVDLFCAVNQSYSGVKSLGDSIINTFTPGTRITLPNGDPNIVYVEVSTPSPLVTMGGWTDGSLYATQVLVYYFGYWPQS